MCFRTCFVLNEIRIMILDISDIYKQINIKALPQIFVCVSRENILQKLDVTKHSNWTPMY